MIVVVTSQSPIKRNACEIAFGPIAGAAGLEIIPIAAKSGVSEQPFNDETVRGARNRIESAKGILKHRRVYDSVEEALKRAAGDSPSGALYADLEAALRIARTEVPLADAWVSIENGIFEEDGRYIDRAVVAIMNRDGKIAISYSDGVAFPRDAVEEARRRGFAEWTAGKIMQEWGLVQNHADPHADLPPYRKRADYIAQALNKTIQKLDKMGRLKILFGVCGIGSGHTLRQLPIIEHFAKAGEIVIFASGYSHDFLTKRFKNAGNVTVARVAVPFYAQTRDGIDFKQTAQKECNRGVDFYAVNADAMQLAEDRLGKPDLVVSDYDPVSAQYAYAKGATFVTIDQQSKYLSGDFPGLLNGNGHQNEIQMLRMFFPHADARLACSFFNVAQGTDARENVEIFPPILNDAVTRRSRARSPQPSILMYISGQQPFGQTPGEISAICALAPHVRFHVFAPDTHGYEAPNLHAYPHGDARFHDILGACHGIVSTAGHTLLSEAMHLGIPVYAIPLPVYEQQMNARIIGESGFGISYPRFESAMLQNFIAGISKFESAIAADEKILLRDPGQHAIIARLESMLKL